MSKRNSQLAYIGIFATVSSVAVGGLLLYNYLRKLGGNFICFPKYVLKHNIQSIISINSWIPIILGAGEKKKIEDIRKRDSLIQDHKTEINILKSKEKILREQIEINEEKKDHENVNNISQKGILKNKFEDESQSLKNKVSSLTTENMQLKRREYELQSENETLKEKVNRLSSQIQNILGNDDDDDDDDNGDDDDDDNNNKFLLDSSFVKSSMTNDIATTSESSVPPSQSEQSFSHAKRLLPFLEQNEQKEEEEKEVTTLQSMESSSNRTMNDSVSIDRSESPSKLYQSGYFEGTPEEENYITGGNKKKNRKNRKKKKSN